MTLELDLDYFEAQELLDRLKSVASLDAKDPLVTVIDAVAEWIDKENERQGERYFAELQESSGAKL